MDAKHRRLYFQCTHRGMKEADIILTKFANHYLPDLNVEECRELEELLTCPDQDILSWLVNGGNQPISLTTRLTEYLHKSCAMNNIHNLYEKLKTS